MANITSRQIIQKIGNKNLKLYKGRGYWYFAYDDEANNFWETESVIVCYLYQMSLEDWVAQGKEFIEKCVKEIAERAEMKEEVSKDAAMRIKLPKRPH